MSSNSPKSQLCTATLISYFVQCLDLVLAIAFVIRHVYFKFCIGKHMAFVE